MYKVMVKKAYSGNTIYFSVTNQPDGWCNEDRKWPNIVEFPVYVGVGEDDQRRRAHEYCNYMNKVPQQPPIGV